MPKLCPKVILEGTRLTHKTDIAFALNEHPRIVGPRKYRYHSPLISAEWCAFTNYPWGRGLINFEPHEEALAMETYRTWLRLFELLRERPCQARELADRPSLLCSWKPRWDRRRSVVMQNKERRAEARKDELITGLRDVRERILAVAASLPPQQRDQVFLGTWSPRDLLAHLAGWDETNLRAAGEILAGKLPGFFERYDRDWTTYNARLVAEYSREDFQELLELVRLTQGSLLTFIQDISAGELWRDRDMRARGWKVTIGRLLEAERSDEEEHLRQLQRFVGA